MRMNDGMMCPVCEKGTLQSAQKKIKFAYKGNELEIAARVFECNLCEESFWDNKDEREIERMLTDERRRIDGLLTSEEIKKIRISFGFSQAHFAKMLGIGEKNFARYETGASMQGRTMDHLLRILMDLPEALGLIAKDRPKWQTREKIRATVQKVDDIPETIIKDVSCGVTPVEDGYYANAV